MSRPRRVLEIIAIMGVNGMVGLLLFVSTVLRETPEFWRNAGGYPVFLRNLMCFGDYPLLILVFSGTTAVTLLAWRYLSSHRGIGGGLLLFSALQWLLLVIILVIMLWNNVDNLLHGRPLHYHPPL